MHNAGGLSFTEALVAGLPAITYLPIPGHGHANAVVLAAAALAPWPTGPAELAEAIDTVCARPRPSTATRPGALDASGVVLDLLAARISGRHRTHPVRTRTEHEAAPRVEQQSG